jgi:methyltransferase (TIGR00027 family)
MSSKNHEPLIRNISDTALWVAVYRARESERPDALFKDPFARRLAGERGEQIAVEMRTNKQPEWPFTARTVRLDQIVTECVRSGADMVVNLAAGLDTRPYRLDLPESLKWVEVDLPAMIDYKEDVLAGERPKCHLERVRLDLRDREGRRALFARLNGEASKVMVMTEGLLAYLTEEEVTELGRDLAAPANFTDWVIDLINPALLKILQKNLRGLDEAGSPLIFGPEEGPDFFIPSGWGPVEATSMLKTAGKIGRLPFIYRLFAFLPDSQGRKPNRPWGGIVRLERVGG